MRTGAQNRYAPRVTPIGHVDAPQNAGMAIHQRLNRRLNGNAVLVFVNAAGDIYAVKDDSETAMQARPGQIVGTYTRRADPGDIAGDIEAWRAAA